MGKGWIPRSPKRKIVVECCEGCPYYTVENEQCGIVRIWVLDIGVIQEWCPLEENSSD